jgi:hypothetical protein
MEDQTIISPQQDQPTPKKPAFDPKKPFTPIKESAKPAFDEGKPFEEVKKKDTAGSVSPSDSSPKPAKTDQSVNISASDGAKAQNYKNATVTPDDVKDDRVGIGTSVGPSFEQIARGINNKSKNLSKGYNAPSDGYVKSLVDQHLDIQNRIDKAKSYKSQSMAFGGNTKQISDDLEGLEKQEKYLRAQIQKEYKVRMVKVMPELLDGIKKKVGVQEWTDAYDNPTTEISGKKFDNPLQWNPETHTLTAKSVQWVAKQVDEAMNKKGDIGINAQVSGDIDKKERTYQDITHSVVDYLNMVPILKEEDNFSKEFLSKNPKLKEAFEANKNIDRYFSKENVDAVKAKVNIERDKELMRTGEKYYGNGGIFFQNSDFVGIQQKYAQLVADKKMSEDVAKKQIQAEINQNPRLKKIKRNLDAEVRKITEKTQKEFQQYIVDGIKKKGPDLTVYDDGVIGIAGMTKDEFNKSVKAYNEGLIDVGKRMGIESETALKKYSNEKAQRVGAFYGSLGSSLNDLSSAFSKYLFNKTQWGGDRVRQYQAEEIASPSMSQSDVAASWNWKGIESLKDPNFWLSKVGSMVPVIAGASAVGLATEGAGLPEYVGWLANAGLFTAQSGLSTYNQLLNTRDAQGNMLTEADASHYMASQMEKDFLPNVMMMALTSGTILRSNNIAKPTLTGTVGKGLAGAGIAQPFFTWQGYNDYATMQEAQGKPNDLLDYMQSPDFKDNLINGLVVGGGLSLLHAPGHYAKEIDNWTKMVHMSEGEFKNSIPLNYALSQEMMGNGNYLRDALKLNTFNIDPESLDEQGRKNLTDFKNTLLYSTNLEKNIRSANLDPKNVNDLYQAHNLALADQNDYLSEQASKEGNKTLSDIYKDKAKDYREQAKDAANGTAQYRFLVNEQGSPIFLSDKSIDILERGGVIDKWIREGLIDSIYSSDNPDFAERYKDYVAAKNESVVSGKDLSDHKSDLIEENKDKLGVYYSVAKENPDLFYKEVSDQVFGRNSDGTVSLRPDAEIAARAQFGDDIVDLAKITYPQEEKSPVSGNKESIVQPKEKTGNPDEGGNKYIPKIESAVIKIGENIYEGKNHIEAIEKAKESGVDISKIDRERDGKFKTSDGRIITRDQAQDEFGADHSSDLIPQDESKPEDTKQVPKNKEYEELEKNLPDTLSPEEKRGSIEGGRANAEATAITGRIHSTESGNEKGEKVVRSDDKIPPPPPTNVSERPVAELPKEEFTAVRKEKNAEIKGAKELFDKQKVVKWTETYDNALKNVQARYPDHNLYDAMKARVNEFTSMLDNGVLFNPTSEDIAVFNVFKDQTKRKIAELPGWDSTEDNQRDAALIQFNALQQDLFNVVRVINPGGEAGRAFNLLQSEINNDPEHGLQIRRMELLGAKGGAKLSEGDLTFTSEQWEKERAIMQKENELREKALQERFNKQIEELKKQFEQNTPTKEAPPQTKKENLLSQKGKDLADKIRSGKFKKGDTLVTFPGLPQTVNFVLDAVATLVEKGFSLAEAIDKFVSDHKVKNKDRFTNDLISVFNKFEKREVSLDKIGKMAQANGLTDVTNEMVAKNLIRDYVNSHVGLYDAHNVLSAAVDGLKDVLPDVEPARLREAYLKEGEFKQPTKKELDDTFKERKRQFTNISKLQEDIEDLQQGKMLNVRNEKSNRTWLDKETELKAEKDKLIKERNDVQRSLRQQDRDADKKTAKLAQLNADIKRLEERGELLKNTKGKPERQVDEDIQKKQQKLKDTLNKMGLKLGSTDKYSKASYEQRSQSHNDRIDNLNKTIEDKITNFNLSDKEKNQLIKLKNQLDAVKIKYNEQNKLSQEKVLQGGLDLLKSVKSEFSRESDAIKNADINRALTKIIDQFNSDKEESEQNIKLARAKDQAKRDIDEIRRKINSGEFEDPKPIVLSKTDAELIKLEAQRTTLRETFDKKKEEYEKKNKSGLERIANFARSLVVDWMIGSPMTLLKVAGSAGLRPQFEAATKLTFGKVFENIPLETTKAISERAKIGGESNSIDAIKKGYEAYLKQFSPEKIEKLITESNNKYEKTSKEYLSAKSELDKMNPSSEDYSKMEKKVQNLKNESDIDLVNAVGHSIYNFISGSSLKEGLQILLHRTSMMDMQFGHVNMEQLSKWDKNASTKEKVLTAIDNADYVFDFIGRSHGALKNFSARFSFAAGFMARLEAAVKDGVNISNPDRILEIANESYLDYEKGKYQESNWMSDSWSKITNSIDKLGDKMGYAGYPPKVLAYLMRSDVAITRVPVNMLREGVLEYTLGAITSSVQAAREYYKAKNIVLNDGWTDTKSEEFKSALREQLQKIDPKQAALIMRSFRKGGFGLGIYALGLLGSVAFGGFPHKGQSAEDKKKKEREDETGVHELKTGEIRIGDWEMPETAGKIMEHTPAFQPLFFGLGLAQVYKNNVASGQTNSMAALNDALAHLQHIMGSIPQIDKVYKPMAEGVVENLNIKKKLGEWEDVDIDGNPIKRKAFKMSDYLTVLPGFSKKDVLTEDRYKQATKTIDEYNVQIGEVMRDANLTDKEKEEKRKELLKERDEEIDKIYEENKENP